MSAFAAFTPEGCQESDHLERFSKTFIGQTVKSVMGIGMGRTAQLGLTHFVGQDTTQFFVIH